MTQNYQQYRHYDKDMEMAILGAILIEKNAMPLVFPLLDTIHFYDPRCKFVYQTLRWMYKNGWVIDLLTAARFVMEKGTAKWNEITPDNIGYFLCQCTGSVVSAVNIETHSLLVRQLYLNRILLDARMTTHDLPDMDAAIATRKLIDDAFKIGKTDSWMTMEEVITKRLVPHMDKVLGKEAIGQMTGFPSLDRHTQGIQAGELVIVGARPSMGKTAWAVQVALNIAKRGGNVGVISLETQSQRLAARALSGESGLDYFKIWQNKLKEFETQQVYGTMEKMSALPFFISDTPSLNAMDIKISVEKLRRKCTGPLTIFIDYLQLISPEGSEYKGNRQREIGEISRMLRVITLGVEDLGIVALAQLNRTSETDGDKKPKARHLRESGDLEQDADKIFMLHRDRDGENKLKAEGFQGDFDATILLEKNKEGWCGEIPLKFKPTQMHFYEESQPWHDQNLTPVSTLYSDPLPPERSDEMPF